jgi:hypothetical protein
LAKEGLVISKNPLYSKDYKAANLTDAEGLAKAYGSPLNIHVDLESKTMYIAGTQPTSISDWEDDVLYIPTDRVEHTARYKQAKLYMTQGIERVVGHSLGGSVALLLQRENPKLESVTYGAPVFNPIPTGSVNTRYRHWGDPVSMMDNNANTSWSSGLNTHSYEGY